MNQTIRTDFIAKLLSQLSDTENSVISPYGITAVLSMAAEGCSEKASMKLLPAWALLLLQNCAGLFWR